MTAASTKSTSDSRCFSWSTSMSCDMVGGDGVEGAGSSGNLREGGW